MKINTQFVIFLFGGILSLTIDWASFILLAILLSLDYDKAKIVSFFLGTFFAFCFNSRLTFKKKLYLSNFYKFLALYSLSLIVNFMVFSKINSSSLWDLELRIFIGLIGSTLASATINYLGMKYLIFSKDVD
jgi:putative flippase GtrA